MIHIVIADPIHKRYYTGKGGVTDMVVKIKRILIKNINKCIIS